jgi:N-acetylmuramoyl-L-alanine amidase
MPSLADRSRNPARYRCWLKIVIVLLFVLVFLSAAPSADEKHIFVYASVATYSVPVVERGGKEYVSLLELLEPLGRVSATRQGPRWKLRYNAVDSEFLSGRTRAKLQRRDFDLTAPFLMDGSRGLVALSSVSTLLPRVLGTPVTLREGARRLFIGNIAIQPSLQTDPSNPGKMVMNFSAPVNPTISTEPGKLRMLFKRDPVVPASELPAVDNKVITQVGYQENNGSLELDINANAPLMASFSNGGRTITVTAIQPAPGGGGQNPSTATTQGQPVVPAPQPGPAATTAPEQTNAGPASPAAATPVVSARHALAVVDAAHGGDEPGALLSATLAEKNVTLGFARLLRHELEQRGFSVLMLRESDSGLSLDQRAGIANATHAGIFISLHAASQGAGVRVYTSLLPVEGESKGTFRAWNAAQAPSLPLSRTYAAAIVSEFQKRQISARAASASLRPLNNMTMPAVAVELAPGPNGIADLPSANYQEQMAVAIADAILPFRDRLGVQP